MKALKFRFSLLFFFSCAVLISACKKDKVSQPGAPAVGTRDQLTQDSIYLYAKETYFWYDQLPDYWTFNARQFANPDSTLSGITKYKKNPRYNLNDPYNRNFYLDKHSFLDDGSIAEEISGIGNDFGFSVFYNSENDLRIKYVYTGTSASSKGLKRGYQILKINGRTDLTSSVPANVYFVSNAIFSGNSSITMTVKALNGTIQDVVLNRVFYSINPIIYINVYPAGNKKIGYMVFNSFTTSLTARLDDAFKYFSDNNVNELIIDLRYNGGGSVQTAEDLVNYIAPASQEGKVMYYTYYNQLMQSNKATILKNQKFIHNGQLVSYHDVDFSVPGNLARFAKKGTLDISRVYFIVTGGTASASELVINSLKPTIDIKLVGRRTYGKPVGFFPIHIDRYDIYMPQFQTKNQKNEGDYFDGLPVDKDAADDLTKEFGDPSEKLLSYALNYAATGVFSVTGPGSITIKESSVPGMSAAKADQLIQQLGQDEFKGMVPRIKKLRTR